MEFLQPNIRVLKIFSQANVGYLPPITAPPTQMNVNYKIINWALSINKELGLSYIFLEVDQAIYAKILDVMFQFQNENNKIFDKIIGRMGGFHILICLLRTIYNCLRNTGLVELLSLVGLGVKVLFKMLSKLVMLNMIYIFTNCCWKP